MPDSEENATKAEAKIAYYLEALTKFLDSRKLRL